MHIVSLPTTLNMIGYGALSDTGGDKKSSSLESGNGGTPDSLSDKRFNGSLQLTPLWEHVVRTQSLPHSIELQQIFLELSDRLRDPEWEVRQHALRVLIDVIPVMLPDHLDEQMAIILNDLIENLGHPAPAVRKGALDSLRVYLSHSKHSEEVLQTIAYEGLENISDHHLQGNVTVGLILSIPSLIFPHKNTGYNVEYPNVQYIVRLLTRKLVQVIFQEVTLRTLVKIRHIIGVDKFNQYLDDIAPLNKTDFNLLCEVYNINSDSDGGEHLLHQFQLSDLNMNKRMIFEPNVFQQTKYWNTSNDTFDLTVNNVPQVLVPFPTPINKPDKLTDGKIILKTEIKLNSETALTMTILEEKSEKDLNSESDNDDDDELNMDSGGVVKVLMDDSEFDDDFSMRRRTPRRVRFGGEVVKLRTPDSDTTVQSDEEQLSITSDNYNKDDNYNDDDVIEITLSTNVQTHQIIQKKIPRKNKHRSYIPIPITRTSQIKLDIVPINKQRITTTSSAPTSPQRTPPTKLLRKLVYQSTPDLAKEYFKSTKNMNKLNRKNDNSLSTHKRKSSRADDVFSPIPVHEEVQVLHNLQAIDQKISNKKCDNTPPGLSSNNKENIDENNLRKHFETTVNELKNELIQNKNIQSRNNWCGDEEESVTSSSGSGSYSNEKSWEDLSLVEYTVIKDLHDKENWRSRVRGREALLSALHTREVLNGIESRASSFLHLLFSSDRHPRVLAVTQEIISMIIDSFSVQTLQSRLSQITAGLARIGGPISIKLSTQLMKKLTPAIVAEHFLNNHSLTGRSSKVKENALQIVIYTVLKFPSTEFNVASLASRCGVSVIDRKRRVRHASLELLALLGQIGSVGMVVDAVQTTLHNIDYKSSDDVLEAIRARLSRKQLPAADENFIVTYAPLTDATGADVDWIYAGSGSMSPSSAKMKANAIYRNRLHSAEPIFFHTSNEKYANIWEEPTTLPTNNNNNIYQNRPRTTGYKHTINTTKDKPYVRILPRSGLKDSDLLTHPDYHDRFITMHEQLNEFERYSVGLPVIKSSINVKSFRNPYTVLRTQLIEHGIRMRTNFLQSFNRVQLFDDDMIHSLPISEMGNYQEYLKRMTLPLREIEATPERRHMFGNPFKIDKRMMVDEADIDLVAAASNNNYKTIKRNSTESGMNQVPMKRKPGPIPNNYKYEPITQTELKSDDKQDVLKSFTSMQDSDDDQQRIPLENIQNKLGSISGNSINSTKKDTINKRRNSKNIDKENIDAEESVTNVIAQHNLKVKRMLFTDIRRPGKNYHQLIEHLQLLKGEFHVQEIIIKQVYNECLRFRRVILAREIITFFELIQTQSENC